MVGRRKKRQRNGRQNLPSVIRKPMHRPYVCRDDDVAELPIRRIHAAQSGALGGRAWNGPHDHDAVNAPLRRASLPAMMTMPGVGTRPSRMSTEPRG
jgi:hypothetical protein